MADATSAASPSTDEDVKCPLCGRKSHAEGKYQRSRSERKKALLRDAKDPNSGLSKRARSFIIRTGGDYTPYGYEVSHEIPLYALPHAIRCKGDVASNMKTQQRSKHRPRHKPGGDQYKAYPPKSFKWR